MSFASLGLSEALVRAVTEQGYTQPTPIQTQAIPAVLAGGDILAGAQTGTGKTAGFVLPILQRLSLKAPTGPARKAPRALILTPTRELAAQVEESVRVYGKHLRVTSMAIFGGVGIGPQTAQLRRGVDIIVATPGRLLDHQGLGHLDLSRIETFVLDEGDRMLDMGFIPDIKRVLALLPARRQNLLFSATFSDEIRALADKLLNQPQRIDVAPRNSTVEMIRQKVHPVDRDRKRELLAYLIGHNDWRQVLVFTRTKHGANKLAEQLGKDGITALAIHGNKSQAARTRALSEFKTGGLRVLVATDIAARGIDIDELPHVVNYDLPNVPEDYVHRIGRTGRAGASGEAISLVCVDEHVFLRDIERLIRREIPSEVIGGFEPDPSARAQPILQRQGRGPSGPGHGSGARGAPRPATRSQRGPGAPSDRASTARPSATRHSHVPRPAASGAVGANGNRTHAAGPMAGNGNRTHAPGAIAANGNRARTPGTAAANGNRVRAADGVPAKGNHGYATPKSPAHRADAPYLSPAARSQRRRP